MKRYLLSVMICLGLCFSHGAQAQKLIHYWHFNNLTGSFNNPNIPPFKADYSLLDTNKATVVYTLDPGAPSTYTGRVDPVTGDTMNARMSQPAGNGLRVRNPSDSMTLVFYIPTTHYKNIKLKFEVQASSLTSGQLQEIYDYSLDSGATWRTTGLNMLNDSMAVDWKLEHFTFGNDTLVNNNSKLAFRIKFAGNTTGSSGNNRFDNITVEGDTLTAATDTFAAVVALNNGIKNTYTLYPNPAASNITIYTPAAGDKTIIIYNVAGQKVYAVNRTEQQMTLPIASLLSGMYYVQVYDRHSGDIYTIKFVKQ